MTIHAKFPKYITILFDDTRKSFEEWVETTDEIGIGCEQTAYAAYCAGFNKQSELLKIAEEALNSCYSDYNGEGGGRWRY